MSEPVGLGLVGCGRAAERLYVPALRDAASVRPVGVTDVSEDRRHLIAGQLSGARAQASLETMLEDPAVEAVVIATPPATHADLAGAALEAGRWVLIEKPLAETLEQGLSLASHGEEATRRIMLGYNRRHWLPMAQLHDAWASEAGPDTRVTIDFSIDAEAWGALTGTVDPLDDLASHYLDLLRYVFDAEIASVAARRVRERAVQLTVRLTNGVVAEMHHEHGDHTRERMRVQSDGRALEARMGSLRIAPADGPARALLDRVDQVMRKLRGRSWTLGRSYVEQLEAFARCVRGGGPARPGYEDGLAGQRALDAAKRSANQQGGEVSIDIES